MDPARLLVTGGNGFLGSKLVSVLRTMPRYSPIFTPSHAECDLTDRSAVRRLFRDLQPQVVIHLAARVGGIGFNREHPGQLFTENLLMGVHVTDEAYRSGVTKFIGVGTICAYPKYTPVPFKEDDLWNGYPEETNAPYGLAKKMLLVQAQAYRKEYGFHAITLFPVNLYGPGDNFDLETSHVIPAMIRKFSEANARGAKEVTLWGDGSPTREFLYVDDAVSGILLATERYDGPEPVNLGSGQEIAIRDLAKLIAEETGFTGTIAWDTSKPNGQPRRCLDVSRAKSAFGFTASTSLAEGIRKTVAWYRKQHQLREVHL